MGKVKDNIKKLRQHRVYKVQEYFGCLQADIDEEDWRNVYNDAKEIAENVSDILAYDQITNK